MIYNSSSDHSYHPPVTTLSPVNSTGNVLDMYPETFGGVRERERREAITFSDTYTCTYVGSVHVHVIGRLPEVVRFLGVFK